MAAELGYLDIVRYIVSQNVVDINSNITRIFIIFFLLCFKNIFFFTYKVSNDFFFGS